MVAVRDRVSRQWRQNAEPQTDPAPNRERHLVIAGTGRAGTSFLVRYLTELGLDTTLSRKGEAADWDAEANAGLEDLVIAGKTLPYVVKSPWIGEYIEQILKEEQFKIDAFIVPVRDLVEVATSRVVLEQRAIHQHNPWMAEQLDSTWENYGHTPGGLVYSLNTVDQARLLAVQFHRLVLKVSESGIPLVFPVFPRIATDWKYLHKCLRPVLAPEITEDQARATHARVADGANVRVTGEIFHDAPSNVIYRKELRSEPHYPSPPEVDNIALRREIGRLRRELQAHQRDAQTSAAKLELERERAMREATIQRLRRRLARRSIMNRMRRLLRIFGGARAIAV